MEIDKKTARKIDRELQSLRERIGADRKTLNEVFDKPTLLAFGKLISDRILKFIDFPISTGKEANVFRAVTPDDRIVAVKVYRIATSNFNRMIYYIRGDPRFAPIGRSKREIINQWVKKELKNLERLQEIEVPAPKPIRALQNILVMEYIGDYNYPAPLLKDIEMKDPERICNEIIGYIKKMYIEGDIIHSDLSEYNILFYKNRPYFIDLAQGVVREHPFAFDFLKRDIENVVKFFRRHGVIYNAREIFRELIA